MAVTRYQPSTDLFRPFLEEMMAPLSRSMRVPDTDVMERENEVRVICELPGMKPEDISLELESNVLTISGEKRDMKEEGQEDGAYHLVERRWGRFTRSFVLPREVESEKIDASYEDGVLTITIPKSESARRRRIEVHGGNGQAHRIGRNADRNAAASK
jgi:HSP20 family protein